MKEYLFQKFEHGIRWNSLESLLYQTFFCAHQIALYNSCNSKLYGSVGVYFSILYLTVGLSNCGLSMTIAPFITYISHSKTHCNKLLGSHILFQLLLIASASIIAGICSIFMLPAELINPYLAALLTALVAFAEGIKRITRSLLQAVFNNKITSLVQIGSIASYCILVWGYAAITQTPCTFLSVVTPWMYISYLSTGLLLFFCIRWYQTLPTAPCADDTFSATKQRIRSAQWSNALLGIIGQLFSRNALVALCTVQYGVEAVAPIKIITYILYSILAVFRNTFQKPSAALLGWSRSPKANEHSVFTHMIDKILHHPISYTILLLGLCYYIGYISFYTQHSISFITVCILCMLCVIENIQMLYESLFLHKERTDLLIKVYSVALLFCGALLLVTNNTNSMVFLSIILGARLVSCGIVAFLAAYLWKQNNAYPVAQKNIAKF